MSTQTRHLSLHADLDTVVVATADKSDETGYFTLIYATRPVKTLYVADHDSEKDAIAAHGRIVATLAIIPCLKPHQVAEALA